MQDTDTTPVPRARVLFREGVDLALRLQEDPENPVTLETIRGWIARSPEHREAWTRVAAIHGMTGKVLAAQRGPVGISRRTLVIGGAIGLGGSTVGALTLPRALLRLRADHLTGMAELREIALADGSHVLLGPESALALDFAPGERRVTLLQGMGFFTVAPDSARPFTVHSLDASVTALGTAFEVSADAGHLSVAVDHGRVAVRRDRTSENLEAGEWLGLAPGEAAPLRGRREAGEVASWRRGMLIADQETVAALVARIARWQEARVVIADPALGARLVSGVFDLRDAQAALEAVIRPFDARLRHVTPWLTIISPL